MAQGQQTLTEKCREELSKHTGGEMKHWKDTLYDLWALEKSSITYDAAFIIINKPFG